MLTGQEGIILADSNITKHALGQAFRELAATLPVEKISVGNICEKCGMNRKSFYYHFKDKYDLINWVFYTEFFTLVSESGHQGSWELLEDLCRYFYTNREMYQKIFSVNGQNSFTEYFESIVSDLIQEDLIRARFKGTGFPLSSYAEFYADAFVCAIKKWILKKDCMPPEDFSLFLKSCLLGISEHLARKYDT